MKFQMRIGCLFLLALLTFSVSVRAAEDAEKLNLRKAQSITFYSGSTLHSWFECNAALDSLNQWESSILTGGIADSLRFERMRMELALGMDNSSANMNGVFPSFGAMTSQRLDYHFIDDPGEVLAEDLVGEFIDMPSKSRKGSYRDNGVFMIVSTSDGNIELANVLMDFLGSQTSAYVVRPHELSGLVPCALEDGPCLQRMDSAEWSGILDYYNTGFSFDATTTGSPTTNTFKPTPAVNKGNVITYAPTLANPEFFGIESYPKWLSPVYPSKMNVLHLTSDGDNVLHTQWTNFTYRIFWSKIPFVSIEPQIMMLK